MSVGGLRSDVWLGKNAQMEDLKVLLWREVEDFAGMLRKGPDV